VDLPTTTNYHFKDFALTKLNQALNKRENNKAPGTGNINMALFK
jgi:hypothetical protein